MFLSFDPDGHDQLTDVYEGTGTTTQLATFAYNNDGTLASRSEGTGISSAAYSWDGIGRLTAQSDVIAGTNGNVGWTFTLNPASQIATEARTETNNAYAYSPVANVTRAYAVNGLNQYTAVGGTAQTYDANGNLTSDGAAAYVFDVENRLVSATIDNEVTNLVYDPLGRLFQTDQGNNATTTRFLTDGDALVGEYGSTNALTARYVHGSNAAADDPLVWYTSTGSATKRWLHADHLGSIVGVTNASGSTQLKLAYDEYGQPDSSNAGRFQYTGQAWIPELASTACPGLYYYKARIYSPCLGRFLQVDPVGYEDQINLYAYVGEDPVNAVDATGSQSIVITGLRLPVPNLGGDFLAILNTPIQGPVELPENVLKVTRAFGFSDDCAESLDIGDCSTVEKLEALALVAPLGTLFKGAQVLTIAKLNSGKFGLGLASRTLANALGKIWVGKGARPISSGKGWISSDGLRQYRFPAEKARSGKYQANFESRKSPSGPWTNNGHLDVRR